MDIKRTITFNEAAHSYTDEYNQRYTSVTTLIGKYHPQFNEAYWAKFKADQAGVSVDVIKQNWKDLRDFSCVKGTAEHKLLEDSINGAIIPKAYSSDANLFKVATVTLAGKVFTNIDLDVLKESDLAKKYPEIFEYLKGKILEGYKLHVEKRIYWAEYLVAGTIDCLLVKGKTFLIVDWKTNKDELKFRSGYYKKVNGVKTDIWIDKKEYFFKPISNVEYCKGNVYTLQLSLYAYLMELWGFTCVGLVLYHIRDNQRPKDYNILYDKSSCQFLLIDHKNASTRTKSNSSIENFGIS